MALGYTLDQMINRLKDGGQKQGTGDEQAIDNALRAVSSAVRDNIYNTPYPKRAYVPAPQAPQTPTNVTTPTTTPTRPTTVTYAPTSPPSPQASGNWFGDLVAGVQNNITQATQGLQDVSVPLNNGQSWDLPESVENVGGVALGLGTSVMQGLGALGGGINNLPVVGDLAKGAGQAVGAGLDWYNQNLNEPVAGIGGALTKATDPYSLVPTIAKQFTDDKAGFDVPQYVKDVTDPFQNLIPQQQTAQAATDTLTKIQNGDVLGAVNGVLNTLKTYGDEQFDQLDAGEQFAASMILDPLNFVGLGFIEKAQKARKLTEFTQAVDRITDVAELAPKGLFGKIGTPAAKATEMVGSALRNIALRTEFVDNADDVLRAHRALIEAGQDAKGFAKIAETWTGMKSLSAQRAQHLLQGFGKQLDEVENAYRTMETVLNGGTADVAKLPKAYSRFLDDVSKGTAKAEDAVEFLKADLAERTAKFASERAAGMFKPKPNALNAPVNVARRLLNEIKGAESLFYIGLSPVTFVRNLVNGIATMAIEGVNPLWDAAQEVQRLRKLGQVEKARDLQNAIRFQERMVNVGQGVREAFGEGGFATSQTGAMGTFMSRMIKGTPLGTPLKWYQSMENSMRAKVWTNTYYRAMQHTNWLPPMDAVTQAVAHQYRVDPQDIINILLENQWNKKQAAQEVLKYMRGERGAALDFEVLAREMGVPKQKLMALLDEHDVSKAQAMARELSELVAQGQDKAQAANDVVARAATETAQEVAARTGQNLADESLESVGELEQRRGELVMQWNQANNGKGAQARKNADALAGEIDAVERRLQELKVQGKPPPDIPAAPTVEPKPPTQPPSAPQAGLRIPPQTSAPTLDKGVQDFARVLAQEPELPNILKGRVDASEWAQMDEYGRRTLLERALAGERNAGNFPLSDVYQGRGDVPTAMPDVTDLPQAAPAVTDLSDVFYAAAQKQIGTATEKGRTVNQHLLNVLNKHKDAGAARFATIDDVKARADEAIAILDNYTPEVKQAASVAENAPVSQVADVAPTRFEKQMRERRAALENAIKMPRHEYPYQLSENVKDAATELKFQLTQGEAGRRIGMYDTEATGVGGNTWNFMAEGSTNAPFYRELYAKYKTNKPAVESALNKIIKDNGLDKGANVERVKEVILKQLAEGLQTSAGKLPPDWEARMLLDYPRDQIDEAWKLWDEAQRAEQAQGIGTQAAAQFGETPTKANQAQGQLFQQGEDSPLFSGTPQRAQESVFIPEEAQGTQAKMFSTAPEFGAKKKKPKGFNAPDAQLRGIDPYAQHGDARQAIQRLRNIANENEDATRILSRDEMLKAKARTQADMYEALLNLWEREDVRRVRAGTDLENRIMAWMRKDVFNAMDDMRMAATVAADWMDNAVMISRDGETYFDAALGVLSPFQFWGTRYALQSMRRVADYPARLNWYYKLREAQDQVQDDPRFPKRLRGMMNIPIPGVPSWARGEMWFDPLEAATSIEQTFRLNQFDDALTDDDIANNLRALASSGEVDPKEAMNAIANKSGALWNATKMRLEELTKTTEGFDAITDVFRPHLPFDIAWKVMTGNANEIGVLFPMTRLIRGATSMLPKGSALNPKGQGYNIEGGLKAGLRNLTGAQDIPDWDMWEMYRTDRALADLVGEGKITERDAVLAMIERRGEYYDMAVARAQEQSRAQSFSVFGGQMFPEGEREYYKARVLRDQLLDQAVAQLGANPQDLSIGEKWEIVRANGLTKRGTPLGDFSLKNPVMSARSDAYAEPEERLKGYLTDEMWKTYMSLSALDKRTARNGNKDLAAFITNPERDYANLTIDQVAAYVKYLRGYTPESELTPKIGNIPQISYADPNQSARYQGILDNQTKLFNMDALQPKLDARGKMTPNDKRAYDAVNPDVAAYMKWYAAQMRANPDISKLIRPDTQAAYKSYVDTRTTNNIVTSNVVRNLDNMVRRIGDSSPRRFNPARNPMNPTKPMPTTPMQLSPKVQAALKQKRSNAKYYIPRDIYAELLALFRQYGNGMDFNTWLNTLLQGGQ